MTLKPFKSRAGFDGSDQRGINFADPRPDTDADGAQDVATRDWVITKVGAVDAFASFKPTTDKQTFSWNAAKKAWELILPVAKLKELQDVSNADPKTGDFLKWDGAATAWTPFTFELSLDQLKDLDAGSPVDGNIIVYDGTSKKYVLKTPTGTQIYSGTSDQVGARTGTNAERVEKLFAVVGKGVAAKQGDVFLISRGVNALYDRYTGPYFFDGTKWVQGASGSGGGGGGSTITYRGAVKDPAPTAADKGDLNVVTEAGEKQINAYDGKAFQLVLGEKEIKSWISAGSLFQGNRDTVATSTTAKAIADLPAPDVSNRSFYWTWTGAASTAITPADFPGGKGFTATLQVGDWVQSDGTAYIHVPSDLLSKLRWERVGAFRPWADTNWEVNSLVTHVTDGMLRYFKSTSAVTTGDLEPGVAGVVPATGTTLRFNVPNGLTDGTVLTFTFKPAAGTAFTYTYTTVRGDSAANRLATALASDMSLNTALVSMGTPSSTAGGVLSIQTNAGVFTATADNGITIDIVSGSVSASKWQDITPTSNLDALTDVDLKTTAAANGNALVWDALTNQWVPKQLSLADLKNVNANAIDPDLHGAVFQWDENVNEWVASDTLYIGAIKFDDTGIQPEVTAFTDAIDLVDPAEEGSTVPTVQAVKDYVKDNPPVLEELADCKELATAEDGQVPVWVAANSRWEPKYTTSPILFLGKGAWNAADVADKTKNYGMPAGTNPDPKVWMPTAGDQYIDLSTGNITLFS